MCSIIFPRKANPELIIDSDAVLTSPASSERLQTIARRNSKIGQIDGGFYLVQLPERHNLDISPAPVVPLDKKLQRVVVFEVLDHVKLAYNATRYM
jgi:hypothetical protein